MPFTVIAPRGVLTHTGEGRLIPDLVEALIETSGLTGNTFFTPVEAGTCTSSNPSTSTPGE